MHCPVCGTYNPDDAAVCRACGAPLGAQAQPAAGQALPPGTKLGGGAYTVGRVLGQGGFGITYLGSVAQRRLAVAVKEFFPYGSVRHGNEVHPSAVMSQTDYLEAKRKFMEEAQMLARFRHPNICKVYAAFEENNTAYMVMEYLKGKTIGKLIEEHGTVPEREAVEYIRQIGQALAVVHRQGVLHRDVKPENIIVTDDGRAILFDFGSARGFAAGKTRHMTTLLTPGYAPLEQYAERAQRGPYTDIYALAATLYHALTGQMPVQATDRATGVNLRPPIELNPEISKRTSDAIMWAMEMKIDDRPQNVAQFLKALRTARPRPRPTPQQHQVPQQQRQRSRPRPQQQRRPYTEIFPGIPVPTLWVDHCISAFIGATAGAIIGSATLGPGGFMSGGLLGFVIGIIFGRLVVYSLVTGLMGFIGYLLSRPIANYVAYTGPYVREMGVAGGILIGLILAIILAKRWR